MKKDKRTTVGASDHLANERTFLAWIRTSIALMGFGFVVVKFSLFVKQLSYAVTGKAVMPTRGFSAIMGIVLVLIGAATAWIGLIRYRRIERQLSEGSYTPSSSLLLVLTALLITGALLLVYYLIPNL